MLNALRVVLTIDVMVAVVALIYFRVGEGVLFPLVSGQAGPWDVIGQLQAVVPIALALWLVGGHGWLIYVRVQQQERVRRGGIR